MLVDSVEIELRAGRGGDGIISWRREKFVPKGGPDGGDGGRGGSVVLKSSNNLDTLSGFRYRKVFHAENGTSGSSKKKAGPAAPDLELLVPVGTKVIDFDSHEVIADLTDIDQSVTVVKGGKGGLGNVHFVSSTRQNPFYSTAGTPGETKQVKLELQFVADVAIVGEPNAGKSSVINSLTGANARIGSYPFSTTDAILGVLKAGSATITLVDLPGLIEGAHKGRGLGFKFLQHTSRVKGFLHILDGTQPDLKKSEQAVIGELIKYDPALAEKPRIIIINKIDLLTSKEVKALEKVFPTAIFISVKDKTNLGQLKSELLELMS